MAQKTKKTKFVRASKEAMKKMQDQLEQLYVVHEHGDGYNGCYGCTNSYGHYHVRNYGGYVLFQAHFSVNLLGLANFLHMNSIGFDDVHIDKNGKIWMKIDANNPCFGLC